MLFETVILRNKAVLNIKRYCMHCYVVLSDIFRDILQQSRLRYACI